MIINIIIIKFTLIIIINLIKFEFNYFVDYDK